MHSLYEYSLLLVSITGLVLILLSVEIGWRLGTRAHGRGGLNVVSALVQSLLGLSALIIGFTFLMALTRFEARREAVVQEANAIGTTALRARLLGEPDRTESLKLLQEYAALRVDNIDAGLSLAQATNVIVRSNEIQEALWQRATVVAAASNALGPTGLFIQSLNEMIDSQAKRLAALRNQIPTVVLLMVLAVTITSSALAGYAGAIEKRPTRVPIYATGLILWMMIYVILDLDRPNVGLIKISQQPMFDVVASIKAFPK